MADRRSQSDESLIVEYFTIQPLAACDALLNQIADQLRKRRPKRVESGNNTKPAEPTERKPSQKRKAGKDGDSNQQPLTAEVCAACGKAFGDNDHHLESRPTYHPFQSASEASKGVGV